MDVKTILKTQSQQKAGENILSGFSISTIPSLRNIENKHDVYKIKEWTKKISKFLREYPIKIIN